MLGRLRRLTSTKRQLDADGNRCNRRSISIIAKTLALDDYGKIDCVVILVPEQGPEFDLVVLSILLPLVTREKKC